MDKLHIITPVKDSIDLTLQTIKSVKDSNIHVPFIYKVYNDFSTDENTTILEEASKSIGFNLINLSDMTSHPSPNYLLVLQHAQQEALEDNADLLIIESDVVVEKDTIQQLVDGAYQQKNCGIAAAVTVDESGDVNYPYLYAKKWKETIIDSNKHCSFCCSLLTNNLLSNFNFHELDPSKNWYDVTISHKSLELGLNNYLFMKLRVLHRPHSSRPWKLLKYSNPLKYYWQKFTRKLDKI